MSLRDDIPALDIAGLGVTFTTPEGDVAAVNDFSLQLRAGECVGVVGESGAGKSQSFLAIMGLLAANARLRGSAALQGDPLIVEGRMASSETGVWMAWRRRLLFVVVSQGGFHCRQGVDAVVAGLVVAAEAAQGDDPLLDVLL